MQIGFRSTSEKPANDADQRFSSEREMIHTSLSRTAHVFAINWSGSHHRRSRVPGTLSIIKRPLLFGVATVGMAVALGFVAGRSSPSLCNVAPISEPARAPPRRCAGARTHYALRAEAGDPAIAGRAGEGRAAGARRGCGG